ncbi:hypothetical protein MRBLWO14_000969 [Microbacterium sp. LWO14-1.2]|uniref:hypothetical protein n=1 Tax=Microbacterium sp. LWO14-1.2 TaxID=3135263 RepID=UPI0031397C93
MTNPETVFILDGELARDEGHHDLLPLPLAFTTREAAEAYVTAQGSLWGEWEIRPVPMASPLTAPTEPPTSNPDALRNCGVTTLHAPHTWGDHPPFYCCITEPGTEDTDA